LIIVDVLALTGAFAGTVCLITVRRSVSFWISLSFNLWVNLTTWTIVVCSC